MSRRTSLLRFSRLLSASKPYFNPPLNQAIKRPFLNQPSSSSPSSIGFNLASVSSSYRPIVMDHRSAPHTEEYSRISEALFKGDLAALRKTLSAHPDIDLNCTFNDDPGVAEAEPLLHQVLRTRLSVKPEDIEIIKVLLSHGCDINTYSADAGGMILDQAARLDSVPLLEFLIESGASVNTDKQQYPDSLSPLYYAVSCDRIVNAQLLISHGAKVDTDSIENARSSEMLELLLSHATSAVIAESRPVNEASRSGDWKYLALLLEKKFDVNAIDGFGQTPLTAASGSSRPVRKIIEMLLENGADVSAKSRKNYGGYNVEGDTALHIAAWRSDVDVVRVLLNASAEINARNSKGQTPLIKFALYLAQVCSTPVHGPEIHPRQRVIQMLIDGGADVNAVDKQGGTALHAAATTRKYGPRPLILDVMKLLVDAGAEVGATDAEGATALDILVGLQAQELIEPFVQYVSQHQEHSKK